MESSSESSKKFVGGLWGGLCSDGFSNPEWFVLVVVESTCIATSCQSGSAGTDSDDVSFCCETWLIKSIASEIGAS